MTQADQTTGEIADRVSVAELDRFCQEVLTAVGADEATATAATRAMMHGSLLGIDSHGVRLLDHYVKALTHGRVNPKPDLKLVQENGATATLDADNAHGARAAYFAMERAVRLAGDYGIGAVAIRNSSHLGPAGAFACAAAHAGMLGLVMCNADSFVRLHGGAMPFHGTNPLACAVPAGDDPPWLLDMATSAITYNRIQLFKSLDRELPQGVASKQDGQDTQDPDTVAMLAPLGDSFGFKGAGLAGLVEIFSAVLTGMHLSFEIAPMAGPDFATPRGLGAFVLALKPGAFVDEATFEQGMVRYLEALRKSPSRHGFKVMAPGDREWGEADRRGVQGIPLDPVTFSAFVGLAERFGIAMPKQIAADV